MRAWLLLAVAIVVSGGGLVALAVLLRRRWLAAQQPPVIAPPRQIFTGHDEGARLRTEARRKAADAIRSRAAHVETGARVSDVLRRIK